MSEQTISKSAKRRFFAHYHKDGKALIKDRGTSFFKEIVIKEEAGKNQKGKTIYSSRTRHLPY